MKKFIASFSLMLITVTCLLAQAFKVESDRRFDGQPEDIQGTIKELQFFSYNKMGTIEITMKYSKVFENNQLVYQKMDTDWSKGFSKYFYNKDGKIESVKTYTEDKGNSILDEEQLYEYKDKQITLAFKRKYQSTSEKLVWKYDKHDRLVGYNRYNGDNQLVSELAHTYDFNSDKSLLMNTLKVEYNEKGQVDKTKSEIYSSESFSIDGEDCTKVRIEKVILDGDKESKEIDYKYVNSRGHILREGIHSWGMPIMHESRYEYDERGNWISLAIYQKPKGDLITLYKRKITYTDGYVSGGEVLETKVSEIDALSLKPSSEQVYYTRYPSKKTVKVEDANLRNISSKVTFYGGLNTKSAFMHYPEKNQMIELIDYYLVEDEFRREAKAHQLSEKDHLFKSRGGHYFIFINDSILFSNDYKSYGFTDKTGIIYTEKTAQSYAYQWNNNRKAENIALEKLPATLNHTYWIITEGNEKANEKGLFLLRKGQIYTDENLKIYLLGEHAVVYIKDEILFLENAQNLNLDRFYPVREITKSEIADLQAKYSSKPANSSASQASKAQTNKNNFGCYNDIACLNRYAINQFNTAKQNGQTDQEAYQKMASTVDQIFLFKKELVFEMMMKLDSKYFLELNKELSPEVRGYIRQKSRETVNQYTEKHGKPKIKTIYTKPNN